MQKNNFKSLVFLFLYILLVLGCKNTPTSLEDDATWIKIYGGNQSLFSSGMVMTGEGSCYIVGSRYSESEAGTDEIPFLIKTDTQGEVLWEKFLGSSALGGASSITPTDDGNFLIAGRTDASGENGIDAFLLKADPVGNVIWTKTYGDSLDEWVSIRPVSDGYFLFGNMVNQNDVIISNPGTAGYMGFTGRSNPLLIKIDEAGNELWNRAYPNPENIIISGGQPTSDGGFLFAGSVLNWPAADNDLFLLKVNADGTEGWSRIQTQGSRAGFDLIMTSDGNYLVAGSTADTDAGQTKSDFLFIKIDQNGTELWSSSFGESDMQESAKVIVKMESGGYLAVSEKARDFYGSDNQMTLLKIDETGAMVWEQKRAASHTMYHTILPDSEGNYLIGGTIRTGTAFNMFLFKTNSNGDIPN